MLMNSQEFGNITSHTGCVANVEANGRRISNILETEKKEHIRRWCMCAVCIQTLNVIFSLIVKRVKTSVVLNGYSEFSPMCKRAYYTAVDEVLFALIKNVFNRSDELMFLLPRNMSARINLIMWQTFYVDTEHFVFR